MMDWMKWRRPTAERRSEPEVESPEGRRPTVSGTYQSLYKYLDGRYANTVVLTFAEIEDLLGFALPELARLREEWWTEPDPATPRPRYADSWLMANRTARPNLPALTVVFDRA